MDYKSTVVLFRGVRRSHDLGEFPGAVGGRSPFLNLGPGFDRWQSMSAVQYATTMREVFPYDTHRWRIVGVMR